MGDTNRLKTKRINFDRKSGENYGLEVSAKDSLGMVALCGLDKSAKPRAIVSLPVENLDELIHSLCTLQEQLKAGC